MGSVPSTVITQMRTNVAVFVRLALPTVAVATCIAMALAIAAADSGYQGLAVLGRLVFAAGIARAAYIMGSSSAASRRVRMITGRDAYVSALVLVPLVVLLVLGVMRALIWVLEAFQI